MEGVIPAASVLDTAGYFARDAEMLTRFGKSWYGDKFRTYNAYPKVSSVWVGHVINGSLMSPVLSGYISLKLPFRIHRLHHTCYTLVSSGNYQPSLAGSLESTRHMRMSSMHKAIRRRKAKR